MNSRELASACVEAGDAFFARRLWQRFDNEDLLVFELPDRPLLVGSIMGGGGREHGLMLLQGDRALDEFLAMADDVPGALSSAMLSMSLERTVDIPPQFARILKQVGRHGRTAPMFLVKEPGMGLRAPKQPELETLLYVLRGILTADDQGRLRPDGSARSRLLPRLRITGDPAAPGVQIRLAAVGGGPEPAPIELAVPADIAALPRREGTCAVGVRAVPTAIAGDDREVRALVAVDVASGLVLGVELVLTSDLEAAATALFAVLRSGRHVPAGLPARIVFANEGLCAALAAGFAALGVPCDHQAELPVVDEAFAGLNEWIADDAPATAPDELPEADDLPAWKAEDLALTERLADLAVDAAMESDRAWRRYFGCPRGEGPLSAEAPDEDAFAAYLGWFAFDWRATRKSRTVAARALDQDLSATERTLLQARSAARPSLYQVRAIEPGESIEVVDVLSGRELRVTDKAMSLSAVVTAAFFARVYAAGSFWFASLASPPFPGLMTEQVLAFLQEEHGLDLDASVPAEASHLLGRLWEWSALQDPGRGIELANTDGHALSGRKARFRVAFGAELIAALARRSDVAEVEAGCQWAWMRGELHLGSLELWESELLLEVNSEERLQAARAWIDQLPGVAFESVEHLELDPRSTGPVPLDDRLPEPAVEPDAESIAAVQAMLNRRYFAWLDQPIPVLGDLTPRQACATAEGRRRVARLIRAYPDPDGAPGVVVPRGEMLRRLGLEGGEAEGPGGE